MLDIRSILSSKLFTGAVVVITLLVMALFTSFKVIGYKNEKIDDKNRVIIKHENDKEVMKLETKRRVFETNQSAIITTQKEVKDEEIPDTVGVHTIIFDDDRVQ